MAAVPWLTALLLAQAAPAPLQPVLDTGAIRVDSVVVSVEGATPPARPRKGWMPKPDPATGLALVHAPGEPLGPEWVRQQVVSTSLVGPAGGPERIGALVQLINLAFAANGYVNSGVVLARQSAGDPVLRLRLIGGHLAAAPGQDAIAVRWRDGHRRGLNARYIVARMHAAREEPLSQPALEQDFRNLADNPAIRTIDARLQPGVRPGEAARPRTVAPAPRFDFYVTAANSRSPSVGGNRIAVGGSIRNALVAGDVLGFEYGSTSGLDDLAASETLPLGASGFAIAVRGGFNRAAVTDRPLVPLIIRSREWYVEGGVTRTLLAEPLLPGDAPGRWHPAQSAAVGLIGVHRQVTSSLLGQPFSFSPGTVDGRIEYTAMRLTGDYTRRSPTSVFALAVTGTLGIEGTRSAPPGPQTPSEHFVALLVQANYARRLTASGLELRLRASGQLAGGLLYSPERFAIGGADTVRGYRESLLLADEALVGSIGLAQPLALGGHRQKGFRPGSFVIGPFVDGVISRNRQPPQPLPTSIASVGASLEWTPAAWLFARGTFAQPLRFVRATGDRNIQDRGFEFRVTLSPLELVRHRG
ncbi:MAG: hypothetical protein NVSMB69_14480 [Novosphingobium sp.]